MPLLQDRVFVDQAQGPEEVQHEIGILLIDHDRPLALLVQNVELLLIQRPAARLIDSAKLAFVDRTDLQQLWVDITIGGRPREALGRVDLLG
ncbi:MAG: hypothetical protein FJ011_27445 [Chloroflexi bacterium]|nr:hypothetical protein [Chloroflexota bacterium]